MMVKFDQVCKSYDHRYPAVNDLSFVIEKGEFVFLTGPSGAGKSTLLKLIYMDEKPDTGKVTISFNDREVYESHTVGHGAIQKLRRKLGVVFQDFRLLSDRTVFDNVAFALEITGLSGNKLRTRVFEVLTQTGVAHRARAFPKQLSGGEQQRVALARAIAVEPFLLIADEPTGNLDQKNARAVLSLLQDIHAKGTTILMASHNQTLMQSLPYRILQLDQGALVTKEPIK